MNTRLSNRSNSASRKPPLSSLRQIHFGISDPADSENSSHAQPGENTDFNHPVFFSPFANPVLRRTVAVATTKFLKERARYETETADRKTPGTVFRDTPWQKIVDRALLDRTAFLGEFKKITPMVTKSTDHAN